MKLALISGLALVLGCGSSNQVAEKEPGLGGSNGASGAQPVGDGGPAAKEHSVTAIEMTFIGQRRDHPPLSTLTFDVVLKNQDDRARWFLLPRKLGGSAAPLESPISAVEVFALTGKGSVLLGQFLGAPGFQAVQLPAGAEVTMRGVEVMLVGAMPAGPLRLEAVIGDSISVGGEPVERWFERATLSDVRADVARAGAEMVGGREAVELKAQPVAIDGAERVELSVAVPRP